MLQNFIKNYNMKFIITERQYSLLEMDSSVRRRLPGIQIFLEHLMETMYVCDYEGITHFMNGVLNEAGIYYDDVDDFQGMNKSDLLETIEDYFEDEVHNYYLERCLDDNHLTEGKNVPTNPKLWLQSLSWVRSRYKVCPSAYCNGAASKRYKSKGGGWKKKKKSANESEETNETSSPV